MLTPHRASSTTANGSRPDFLHSVATLAQKAEALRVGKGQTGAKHDNHAEAVPGGLRAVRVFSAFA